MKLVYYTSRKTFVNRDRFLNLVKENKPFIMSSWHSCIMMGPFLPYKTKKFNPDYKFFALASRHGDGQFVNKIVAKFGVHNVYGSSRLGRKDRGIDLANFRKIFDNLKSGYGFIITPDGPRGPNQKINGQIINIAKIASVPILPVSYFSSRFIRLKTWDKLMIPLPFSRICYDFAEEFYVDKNIKDNEIEKLNKELEDKINNSLKRAEQKVL